MMIKNIFVLLCFSLLMLSSCAVLKKEDYQSLVNERDSLANALLNTTSTLSDMEESYISLKQDTATLKEHMHIIQEQNAMLFDSYTQMKNQDASDMKSMEVELSNKDKKEADLKELIRLTQQANKALYQAIANAIYSIENHGMTVSIRDNKVYIALPDILLFDKESIELDEQGKLALSELCEVLRSRSELKIIVEGHADSDKLTDLTCMQDNWDLSVLRATSVVRYMVKEEKILAENITASGKAHFYPIDKNDTPSAMAKNRRIEIIVEPDLAEILKIIESRPASSIPNGWY